MQRWGTTDDPRLIPQRIEKRLMGMVTVTDAGCWQHRSPNGVGYGFISVKGRPRLAHRVMYEIKVGGIPEGYELDHLCRNRACCNPAHLEPVTHRENVHRGAIASTNTARSAARTHCKYGHELTPENTYTYRKTPGPMGGNGGRGCRTCKNAQQIEYAQRQKALRS